MPPNPTVNWSACQGVKRARVCWNVLPLLPLLYVAYPLGLQQHKKYSYCNTILHYCSSTVSNMLGVIKAVLPDWPEWAIDVLLTMTALLCVIGALTTFFVADDEKDSSESSATKNEEKKELHRKFDRFRHNYIVVYLVIMLADWMQGTHMYTLYLSYDVNISALFLTGFLSGAFFAPFLGSAVDKFGRRNSCIVYCVLEIIINTLEHSSDFKVLLLGRVMGGISTNLLFSAFESWMTTEHRKQGFPEEWLTRTYSEASIGNGAMAILAGIISQVLEDKFGHIGPFQGAIFLTVVALVLVMSWKENYGENESKQSSLAEQFSEGWRTTLSNSHIWKIGLTQALSEGAMYTFVFMWVPTLLSLEPPGGVPTGCVFSAMMMSITIGGMLYPPLQALFAKYVASKAFAPEACASFVYALAAASMAVPAIILKNPDSSSFLTVIVTFMVVEACVGLFMPVAGTLRSKYVPDALQGAILNIFRLPLNAVVVSGTYATDIFKPADVFSLVSVAFLGAALLQVSMMFDKKPKEKQR
eukprot:Nitzschia sp. Nitz4//scaffold4_size323378//159788//161601//NITZ4_000663-RA/size323378-snap-gene-0.418-mRNA-1//1//CDS//3329553408//3165//frame0